MMSLEHPAESVTRPNDRRGGDFSWPPVGLTWRSCHPVRVGSLREICANRALLDAGITVGITNRAQLAQCLSFLDNARVEPDVPWWPEVPQ